MRSRLASIGLRSYWDIVFPAALLVALVVSIADDSPGGTLALAARVVAILLLVAVAGASAQLAHQRRTAVSHASIRADIAASGGLGKRLTI